MNILVTGANGFIGNTLCRYLAKNNYKVIGTFRQSSNLQEITTITIKNIDAQTNWTPALYNVDTVIHLAARVHVMRDISKNPLDTFRLINTQGTFHLAHSAAKAGVRRLIYISTIKINGEQTWDIPFTEKDTPNPQDAYAISKWEAEQGLQEIAKETGLELVIIRPPLVYGAGVKGNMRRLIQWVDQGIPLPLGRIKNQRSLIGVENLVDLIVRCIDHPKAVGEVFLASDGEDISTPALFRQIASHLARQSRLIPVPDKLLGILAKVARKDEIFRRLAGSLQIDSSKARRLLDWQPPYSLENGLYNMCIEYQASTRS